MRGFKGLDVGDRVRVQLMGTDVERGFIDFRPSGKRAGILRTASVKCAKVLSCFRTNVPQIVPQIPPCFVSNLHYMECFFRMFSSAVLDRLKGRGA